MKKYSLVSLLAILLITISFGSDDAKSPKHLSKEVLKKGAVVKASCGQCKFDMKGKGCDLAVEINGQHYFVAGADIDDYGNAHSARGFCKAIRNAKVKGTIKGGKFHPSWFILLKEKTEK